MLDLGVIDVGIGLITVYLLLGLVCSAINELISLILELRANILAEGLQNILNDTEAREISLTFYNHPLIKSLGRQGKKPSYIPTNIFTMALLDIIMRDEYTGQLHDIRTAVENISNPHIKTNIKYYC